MKRVKRDALRAVIEEPWLTCGALADRMGCAWKTAHNTVRALEADGYLTIRRDTSPHRIAATIAGQMRSGPAPGAVLVTPIPGDWLRAIDDLGWELHPAEWAEQIGCTENEARAALDWFHTEERAA